MSPTSRGGTWVLVSVCILDYPEGPCLHLFLLRGHGSFQWVTPFLFLSDLSLLARSVGHRDLCLSGAPAHSGAALRVTKSSFCGNYSCVLVSVAEGLPWAPWGGIHSPPCQPPPLASPAVPHAYPKTPTPTPGAVLQHGGRRGPQPLSKLFCLLPREP